MYTRNCEIKNDIVFPDGMTRLAACIEYKGTQFHGFQKQKTAANTIQAALENAFSQVADEPITIVCAGRTDAGVHATNQIIHFDTLSLRSMDSWCRGANTYLPPGIVVKWVVVQSYRFHARFSALSRTYRYVFLSQPTKPGILRELVTWTRYELSLSAMEEASQYLVGEHDFSSFRASQCQAVSPVRRIYSIQFRFSGAMLVMEIHANAFLHHMVRNISGLMIDIGRGAKPASWAGELLALQDRAKGAATASPNGLYLVNVAYPDEFSLPNLSPGPDFVIPE